MTKNEECDICLEPKELKMICTNRHYLCKLCYMSTNNCPFCRKEY